MTTQRESRQPKMLVRSSFTMLGLTLSMVAGAGLAEASVAGYDRATTTRTGAAEQTASQISSKAATPLSTTISRADKALARALASIRQNHPGQAVDALRSVRVQVSKANQTATGLIGKPPTDPESDDLPGPPAVLAALKLEHRVASGVVGPFDGLTNANVIGGLRLTLTVTHHRRDAMLDAVIALPPEGAGADYADGMADTLTMYTKEVQQLTTAVTTYQLTTDSRAGLVNGLARAHATKAKVDAAFGGGEKR